MPTPPPAAVRTRVGDLPAAFWWLWLAVLVTWIGRFVVPFLTLYLTSDAGLSSAQAGTVVAAYGVGIVVSTLVGGVLTDRVGRKATLAGSELLSAVALLLVPSFASPVGIAVLLLVYGLVSGAAQPAIATMVADMVPPAHRRAAFSYNTWAINLGYAIGPMLAGLLADQAFELLFYAQAGVLVVSGLVVLAKVPETRHVGGRRPQGRRARVRAASPADVLDAPPAAAVPADRPADLPAPRVWRDRVFLTFVLAMFLYSVVYVQSTTTLPLVMTEQGMTSREYGYLLTLNGLLLCLLQIPAVRLLGRWRHEVVLATAVAVTAVGMLVQSAATTLAVLGLAVAVWTLGELGTHPVAQATSADLAPARSRGRYQGTYALSFSAATVVAPIVGGLVLDAFGSRVLWWGCAGLCLLVCVLLTLTARSRERRAVQVLAENEGHDAPTTTAPGGPDRPADRTHPADRAHPADPTYPADRPLPETTPAPATGAVQDLRVR
ncbi:MDR family MFS transporter [Cellulomonas aerilata]|uniref:MFS transporter n=1 Tax=Cellulomonas aerilata TaxID=515326 RepID=A0A512DCA9_9CELL|nr:MFS transporter [Cellulomonas aerilata]GEO34096.1 MFS transporter [Cellulomonas aerilata]